jgi:hypothetical protein
MAYEALWAKVVNNESANMDFTRSNALAQAFVFAIGLLPAFTMAQTNRGTVSALVTFPAGTIVAADSRNNYEGKRYRDDMCKIRGFGNKVAVTLGGVTAHSSVSKPAVSWNAFTQLTTAYETAPTSTPALAQEWLNETENTIRRDVDYNPNPLIGAMDDWNGHEGVVVTGLFAGTDDLEGLAARLRLIKSPLGFEVRPELLRHPPHDCDFVCGGVGAEIIDEIRLARTKRSQHWHQSMINIAASERAIEAIQLTIDNAPHKEKVGGKVDALQVSVAGLHWIQRKSYCPIDSAKR